MARTGRLAFWKLAVSVGDGGELLDAVEAAVAEVEDEEEGFSLVGGEGGGFLILIGEGKVGGGGG